MGKPAWLRSVWPEQTSTCCCAVGPLHAGQTFLYRAQHLCNDRIQKNSEFCSYFLHSPQWMRVLEYISAALLARFDANATFPRLPLPNP